MSYERVDPWEITPEDAEEVIQAFDAYAPAFDDEGDRDAVVSAVMLTIEEDRTRLSNRIAPELARLRKERDEAVALHRHHEKGHPPAPAPPVEGLETVAWRWRNQSGSWILGHWDQGLSCGEPLVLRSAAEKLIGERDREIATLREQHDRGGDVRGAHR